MKYRKSLLIAFALVMSPPTSTGLLAQSTDLVPIISYEQEHPLIDSINLLPMVQVFSDGRVTVYRNTMMQRPGLYNITISDADLANLKLLAETAGVLEFDASEITQASNENAQLIYSSDPTTSIFEFNRVSGQNTLSAGDGTTTDDTHTVEIKDIPLAASSLPDSATLSALNELHTKLIDLFTQAGKN